MAHYFLFPEKDTTIYSHTSREVLNTGIDEVLTLRDEPSSTDLNYYPSRILIQFKQSEINNVINDKVSGPFSASLNLYQTEHRELSINQNLEVFPLSGSWNNGTGRYTNIPIISDGCSWLYMDGSPDAISNDELGTKWTTENFTSGVTASFTTASIGGGTWYTGSGFEVTRTYGYGDNLDLSFDLTNPILKHVSNSLYSSTYPNGISNNGFIIKRADSQEFTAIDDGELNYFSVDTHTIFPPYLDISWDDSSYDTDLATDSTILKTGEIFTTLRNNKGSYKTVEEPKFRLNVRELYPTRKFVTSSNFLDVKYFTSKSYYSLVDYATEETIIPFGEESKLSADAEGMYFKLYMQGLQEERYYKFLFKHENNDGIEVYDDDYYFKVVKT
tara:strand:+ start:630 stop:1790 length:1161 start_codon:yes stop_codon:yes gene_type:complete